MMKTNRRWLKCKSSLFVLIMGLLLPLAVFTDTARAERSFTMEQVIVEADVLPNASMQVTEKLTIDFSGQWNGFYIKIPQGDTPIEAVVVYENGQPYKLNTGKEYGPPGTYMIKNENGKVLIDWSIDAKDQIRTFDVSYRVKNAVKIHSDAAELYRKFIGSDNSEKIREVKVNLKLPAGAEKYEQGKDIRIWGHGPLEGEVDFSGLNSIVWQVKNLPAYTFVEGRVVMPAALFTEAPSNAFTNKNALANILAEEEKWADDANSKRWLARAEVAGAIALIVGSIVIVFLLWRKYGRRYPTQFDGPYYRELPANYSPAELSVLWNFNKIKAHDLTATILDLARRKFLLIEEERQEVNKLFGSKEIKMYRLTFLDAPEPSALRKPEDAVLRDHERDLLNYLHNIIAGGRESLYLNEIEVFAKKYAEHFYSFWKEWTAGLNEQGERLEFFDHSGNMPLFTVLGGLVLFTLGAIVVQEKPILGAALLGAGTIIGIIPRLFKRRLASGEEDYVRWQAFKRFLEHFSQMERHEIPSLIIWEHYLVYAVTLGVAREVMKQLELVFPNMQDGDHRFGYGWYTYGAWNGFDSLHNSFDDIGDVVERSLKTAQAAVSKSSSGSGGGGGFSSGGGGGGGGSSYGGR